MEQLRLRLTGESGSGFCVFLLEEKGLRFRVTVEGSAGGSLELLVQGRSPRLEQRYPLAVCGDFTGLWEAEGQAQTGEVGWLWLLRDGKAWLDAPFPGVGISRGDALAALVMPSREPRPLLPLSLPWQVLGDGQWARDGLRLVVGSFQAPPRPDAVFLAGEAEDYWLWQTGEDPL